MNPAQLENRITVIEQELDELGKSSEIPRDIENAFRERFNLIPNYSHVRAKLGATQAIADSTYTIIGYLTEDYDTLGEFTNNSTGRFTALNAGYYHVVAQATSDVYSFAATKLWSVSIFKNGTQIAFNTLTVDATASNTKTAVIASTVYLNAGDYIDARVYHTQGGSVNIRADATRTFITIDRLS